MLKLWVGLYVGWTGSGRACPHWIWAFTGADEAPWESLVCSGEGESIVCPPPKGSPAV